MKKHLLLLAFLLSASITMAQKELSKDYNYSVSNPYRVFDADSKLYFSKNDQILTVKIEGKEILLQKFSTTGEKISFLNEKLYVAKEEFPKNYMVEDVMEINDKFYFFYSSWNGDDDKEQLFVREIDFGKGEFTGDNKLLFQVDGKIAGSPAAQLFLGFAPGINIGVTDKFDILTSLEKKRLLIQYRKKPKVKSDVKSKDVIGIHTFDENLNIVSSTEMQMPYTERRMDLLDYAIDGEANAYALVKVFHDDSNNDKKKRKDKEANYHIELFRMKPGSADIDITKVELEDKFINGLWVYEGPDNNMICAGFYNKGKDISATDGIMLFKVKKDGGIYDMSTHEIPLEVLNEYASKKMKRKNKKKEEEDEAEFNFLKLRELAVNTEDGSIVLVGEQNFTRTYYTQKSSYTRYFYYDVLVTKIDASGNLAWMKKLPKRQVGGNGRGGMSFKYMFANNNHYVLFLDNVKNHNLPVDEVPAVHSDGKGGYFTSYKISDSDGSSVNSSVFNVRDIEEMTIYQFATSRIVKTAEDEFALEVYKKKKEDVMIKVHIN